MAAIDTAHDLLLALAGYVDDDLLAWGRELVAVGDDGHAVELLAATLVAERTAVPGPVRDALVAATRGDLDADAALPPAADDAEGHRFARDAGPTEAVAAALAALPGHRLDGCDVRIAWRCTPAGTAPGPVPHPVLLVAAGAGRSAEVLAYQLGVELDRLGLRAGVEVLPGDGVLPDYHRAALAAAVRVPAGRGTGPQPVRPDDGRAPSAALAQQAGTGPTPGPPAAAGPPAEPAATVGAPLSAAGAAVTGAGVPSPAQAAPARGPAVPAREAGGRSTPATPPSGSPAADAGSSDTAGAPARGADGSASAVAAPADADRAWPPPDDPAADRAHRPGLALPRRAAGRPEPDAPSPLFAPVHDTRTAATAPTTATGDRSSLPGAGGPAAAGRTTGAPAGAAPDGGTRTRSPWAAPSAPPAGAPSAAGTATPSPWAALPAGAAPSTGPAPITGLWNAAVPAPWAADADDAPGPALRAAADGGRAGRSTAEGGGPGRYPGAAADPPVPAPWTSPATPRPWPAPAGSAGPLPAPPAPAPPRSGPGASDLFGEPRSGADPARRPRPVPTRRPGGAAPRRGALGPARSVPTPPTPMSAVGSPPTPADAADRPGPEPLGSLFTPARQSPPDPLSDPLREPLLAPRLDPTIHPDDPLGLGLEPLAPRADPPAALDGAGPWGPPEPDVSAGASPTGEDPPGPAPAASAAAEAAPVPAAAAGPDDTAVGMGEPPAPPTPFARPTGRRHRADPGSGPTAAGPAPAASPASGAAAPPPAPPYHGPDPESLAALSDTERALLARLQAELAAREAGAALPGASRNGHAGPDS